ncbi:MAG: hypothetical protein L0Y56_22795, partial [Nitrospira sp.]|nr:hypothetical protein [Nitrospira sp.]
MEEYKTLQELFSSKKRWTKHSFAKDKYGKPVPVRSKKAVSFCLRGGIIKLYGEKTEARKKVENQVMDVLNKKYITDIAEFND